VITELTTKHISKHWAKMGESFFAEAMQWYTQTEPPESQPHGGAATGSPEFSWLI